MAFIHDDFMLSTDAARELYHNYAKNEPICDYHCHLPPNEVAEDKRWETIGEVWLGGDHYKWRAMRTHGIPESVVTGNASWKEKFLAWAQTVPHTLRNPLHHWTQLELTRYFGIDDLLSPATAEAIWDAANEKLAAPEFSTQQILKDYDVRFVGTTDDPCDSLEHHIAFAQSDHPTRMVPTFRPDKAMNVSDPSAWNAWVDRLESASGDSISSIDDFVSALESRHAFFHSVGGRLSDHGITHCPFLPASNGEITTIFNSLRSGRAVSAEQGEQFATFIMQSVGRWNASRGWTMQMHLGAQRNNRTSIFKSLGPDVGCDSITDGPITDKLSRFMDSLDVESQLPKVVLYNVNPGLNYPLAAMIGNFQDGTIPGKIQFGSGWWFLDQIEGMTLQINALSNLGLLSHFIGMLTDSRSFLSFPRHEYFRRLLCEILGNDIESGLVPRDFGLVGDMVRRICFENAVNYLRIPGK